MPLPDVTVVICTYDRYDEIKRTAAALLKHIKYPREHLHLMVADDSTPGGYISKLKRLKNFQASPDTWASVEFVKTSTNVGWGANVNNALRTVSSEFVFFIEDDYELQHDLDLEAGAALLEVCPHIGMLRYRGTAGTHLVLHQFEANVSEVLGDYRQGEGTQAGGRLTYLQIDGGSPALWIYSNGPHLKRMGFHGYYGAYPEGLKLGATETAYAHTVKDLMRANPDQAPGIAILPTWVPMRFAHIGKSYQWTEEDTGND